jgi:hypothetical protein
MGKIIDKTSEPMKINMPNGMPQTIRQRLVVYKIQSDPDMEEITEELLKGRDIILNLDRSNAS